MRALVSPAASHFAAVVTLIAQVSSDTDDAGFSLLYVLVGIAVGGGIGAAIGSTKNRIGLGFILGAILGCIGWIVIAVMPKKLPKY
jgi:hypothetical protein